MRLLKSVYVVFFVFTSSSFFSLGFFFRSLQHPRSKDLKQPVSKGAIILVICGDMMLMVNVTHKFAPHLIYQPTSKSVNYPFKRGKTS